MLEETIDYANHTAPQGVKEMYKIRPSFWWLMGHDYFFKNIFQVAPDTHWPELEVLILVVSDQKKHVSSTAGMQSSVDTSSLIQVRYSDIN